MLHVCKETSHWNGIQHDMVTVDGDTAGLLHNTALSTGDKTNSSKPGSLVIPFLDVLIIKIRVEQI